MNKYSSFIRILLTIYKEYKEQEWKDEDGELTFGKPVIELAVERFYRMMLESSCPPDPTIAQEIKEAGIILKNVIKKEDAKDHAKLMQWARKSRSR